MKLRQSKVAFRLDPIPLLISLDAFREPHPYPVTPKKAHRTILTSSPVTPGGSYLKNAFSQVSIDSSVACKSPKCMNNNSVLFFHFLLILILVSPSVRRKIFFETDLFDRSPIALNKYSQIILLK